MVDYKNIIIDNLKILHDYEKYNKNYFKSRAYLKVIKNLSIYDKPIKNIKDMENIEGVGDKIKAKVEELIEKGKIAEIESIKKKKDFDISKTLLNIYGIGPAKANELINKHNIESLDDLVKNQHLLNEKQLIGLKYYKDLIQRIPAPEVKKHEKIFMKEINKLYKGTEVDFVGSYRRGHVFVGDIDVLIKKNSVFNLKVFINYLLSKEYIIDILALGNSKFMGIVKVRPDLPARRMDILVAEPDKYYFALLYFTGPAKFNVELRKHANKLGFSLSEHGLKKLSDNKYIKDEFNSEEAILKYLDIPYISPNLRIKYF